MGDKQRLRPACAYAQSGQSLCYSLEYSITVKLLTAHHVEFLSLKGGCTGDRTHHIVGNLMLRLVIYKVIYSVNLKVKFVKMDVYKLQLN